MEASEVELKFELSEEALPALDEQAAFAAPAETSRLRSVYFDTPGYALKSAGFGLRVRQDEDRFVQTLKSEQAASPLMRREWESQVAGERPDPAALADTPAAKILDGDGGALEPVFTTAVERTRRLWTRGKNVVEISLDRGEITSGVRHEPIFELELELKAGSPRALFELAGALSQHTRMPLLFQSKAERGYHLAMDPSWAPQRAESAALAPETPVAKAFGDIARSCLAQVANNARLLRRYRSLEALHQMRVGLRRFRAALTAFRALVEDREFARLKAESEWLAGELDAARDVDVFIHEGFRGARPAGEDREAFARLGACLLQAQTRAYERALTALDSPRFVDFMLMAVRWLEMGDWLRSDEPVLRGLREGRTDEFARDRLDRMRRQVRKRGRRLARLDSESRHRLRIKAKKLRYTAEFFSGSFGLRTRRRRFFRALGDLQDGLGRLNDVAVAPKLALERIRGQAADTGYAAGLIVADRRASAPKAERAALAAFEDFDSAKPFW
ncbi:MAG TPA: CHAD domain-containing protein [Phenylobacterium sp.]|nr:CHAD domain-containing protein [Phenylobacterium sp.]